jgi:hypothetical protein
MHWHTNRCTDINMHINTLARGAVITTSTLVGIGTPIA